MSLEPVEIMFLEVVRSKSVEDVVATVVVADLGRLSIFGFIASSRSNFAAVVATIATAIVATAADHLFHQVLKRDALDWYQCYWGYS